MVRRIVAGLGALLALFHVWLFAGQVWSGRAIEPGPLVRWLLAFGLIAALVNLRRHGAPLVFGRQAVAVWLLAALLHGPALASRMDDGGAPMLPEVIATMTLVATTAVGAALGLALLGALFITPLAPGLHLIGLHRAARRRQLSLAAASPSSPRPPPFVRR